MTSVSVLCVGSAALTGSGGALSYKNNITVIPGNVYNARVAYEAPLGYVSFFNSTATVYAGNSNKRLGDGGGDAGTNGFGTSTGGYAGNGGDISSTGIDTPWGTGTANTGNASTGGASGRGSGIYRPSGTSLYAGGGGVGILGQGASGATGTWDGTNAGGGGGGSNGGSGGATNYNGGSGGSGGAGGLYGGHGGYYGNPSFISGSKSVGAVRIIWPGTSRSFPSTGTADA